MLVLSRRPNEAIVIGTGPTAITVHLVEIRGDKARLGIVAPKDVPVDRLEVYEEKYGTEAADILRRKTTN